MSIRWHPHPPIYRPDFQINGFPPLSHTANTYELVRLYETNIATHMAHSQPYAGQAANTPAVQTPKATSTKGTVQGNRQSKIYHLPGCPDYDSLSSTNVVTFANETAARKAGYRKAKNCP